MEFMIEKIKNSFLWELDKRISNPYVWSFIIAWIFWNWDFIYAFFFLDQQYVSVKISQDCLSLKAWCDNFLTKVEYLKRYWIYNVWDFVINPLWSSFIVYLGIEWISTLLNIWVTFVKNKILWLEMVTKDEYQAIKIKVIEQNRKHQEEISKYVEENLRLNSELDVMENKIEEKWREIAKKEVEKKNKEISRLMVDIDNRDKRYKQLMEEKEQIIKIVNDLWEKNYNLDLTISEKIQEVNLLKQEKNRLEEALIKQKIENNDKKNSNHDFRKEYDNFKKTKYFNYFKDLIENIDNIYARTLNQFDVISKKYFEAKWIIKIIENFDYNWNPDNYYIFTDKWNKFLEYYLDENDIGIEDIPF